MRKPVVVLVVFALVGMVLPASADPVDDAKTLLCSVLAQAGASGLLDCDADGDGFTPSEGDCNDADPAINPGAADDPDLAFVDTNCDGIDGDAARATFVSPSGQDSWPGTPQEPKRTLGAGVVAAAADGRDVYVDGGRYETGGGLPLVTGVSIYGGYGSGWSRPGSTATVIAGAPQAVVAEEVEDVVLQLLTAEGHRGPGGTAYGMRLLSSVVRLEAVSVTAGPGAVYATPPNPVQGPAAPGQGGVPGSCDAAVMAPGGNGGGSPIGRAGGRGGDGRYALAGTSGTAGSGPGGGGPGAGGPAGTVGQPGFNGAPGAHGANGTPGLGGANTALAPGDEWIGRSGMPGTNGVHGSGGGGGGAGGGQAGFFVIDGTGNGGGGGGAGGEGGPGGSGGAAGGGSFGVFLNHSVLEVSAGTTIAAGAGGRGSDGASGVVGQQGGAGGPGASACTSEVGRGGNGGAGGNGGRGGEGGGGAGGPSIGIYRGGSSSATITDSPQPTHAAASQGGFGPAGGSSNGQNGIAAAVYP